MICTGSSVEIASLSKTKGLGGLGELTADPKSGSFFDNLLSSQRDFEAFSGPGQAP